MKSKVSIYLSIYLALLSDGVSKFEQQKEKEKCNREIVTSKDD